MERLLDVVLHPIRMRVIMALVGAESTAQLMSDMLGDVPPATLYRHLNRLVEAGVLKVIAERRVRGTLEKVYSLDEQGPHLSPEDLASASRRDHLRYFTTFVASLLDDYARYLENSKTVNLLADGVSYRKFPLELSDKEFAAISKAVDAAIIPYLKNKSARGRKRRIAAIIVMPDKPAIALHTSGEDVLATSRARSNTIKERK